MTQAWSRQPVAQWWSWKARPLTRRLPFLLIWSWPSCRWGQPVPTTAGGWWSVDDLRVGHGFDVHPIGEDQDRPLVLGGVQFDGPGLVGHSDADVVAHACADALLGAAGRGDLGERFPDTDPTLAGADSLSLLADVVADLDADGWEVCNVDCTVVLEEPRLAPHREEMQRRLGEVVGAPVGVRGRRAESLGPVGRGEAVVCLAVALIRRR